MVPRAPVGKQLALLTILALVAAGCGSSGAAKDARVRVARGAGYSFRLADGWQARATAHGLAARPRPAAGTLVSVSVFRLLKPYRPSLFPQAAKELDGVATELAAKAGGTVTQRETTTVDGRRVRAYRYTGGGTASRIAFVLEGRREYQLLCQAPAGQDDPDGACARLFASFRIRGTA